MQNKQGFTLIEMMLVIAVIAIIASFALMMYKKSSETARVDKAAVEMQHILEAALAYNVDSNGEMNGGWPDAQSCSTQPDTNNSFVKNYIPNQNTQSTYGSYFCWGAAGGNGSKNGERLFWVAMKVPTNKKTLANRIAARLPNAITTSEPTQTAGQAPACTTSECYVRAEVVQPSAASNSSGGSSGSIVATGNCPSSNNTSNSNTESSTCKALSDPNESKYEISFNACPSGKIPRTTVFPNTINAPSGGWPGYTFKNIDAERTPSACTTKTVKGIKKENCDVTVHVSFCGGAGPDRCYYRDIKTAGGSAGASYMVACVSQKAPR